MWDETSSCAPCGFRLSGVEPAEDFCGHVHVQIAVDLVEHRGGALGERSMNLRQEIEETFRSAGFHSQQNRFVESAVVEDHALPPLLPGDPRDVFGKFHDVHVLDSQVAGLDVCPNPTFQIVIRFESGNDRFRRRR